MASSVFWRDRLEGVGVMVVCGSGEMVDGVSRVFCLNITAYPHHMQVGMWSHSAAMYFILFYFIESYQVLFNTRVLGYQVPHVACLRFALVTFGFLLLSIWYWTLQKLPGYFHPCTRTGLSQDYEVLFCVSCTGYNIVVL